MKLLTYILFLVFIITNLCSRTFAQDRINDSLITALKSAPDDTTKIKILAELSEVCELESIINYSNACILICEKNKSASKAFLNKYLGSSYNNIGFLKQYKGDSYEAINYYHLGLKYYRLANEKKGTAISLNNLATIFKDIGDIVKALDYYHQSLKIKEQIGDKNGIATTLNNIAGIYESQGESNKALEYYLQSLKLKEELKEKAGIATSLNNIGLLYSKQANFELALNYYSKSLKIREQINDLKGIANSMQNLGIIYEKQKEFETALNFYNRSLKIRTESGDKIGIIYTCDVIAIAYSHMNQISKAMGFAKTAFSTAKELGYPEYLKNSAAVLKLLYKEQKQFKEALEMYELEINMNDSINNAETKKASIKKQFQYQYEKKAAADSVKNAEEQKVKNAQLTAQQAQLKQERTQRFALYSGLLLVIAFSGFVYNRFKITQKQKLIIENQKHEVDKAYDQLHEKNKEVMDSILYARRIQRALLTPEKTIAKDLKRLTS